MINSAQRLVVDVCLKRGPILPRVDQPKRVEDVQTVLRKLGFSLDTKGPGASWRSLLRDQFEFVTGKTGAFGWIRRDWARELSTEFLPNPEEFLSAPRAVVLKDRPKSILYTRTVGGKQGPGLSVVIKRVRCLSLMHGVGSLFTGAAAQQSLRGALILRRKGFDTPTPIAAIESRVWNLPRVSYYVAAEITDGNSLRVFWQRTLPAFPRVATLGKRMQVLRDVAGLLHRLHANGIFHRDLKGSNVLLREDELNQSRQYCLVDVGEVRERHSVPRTERIRNLVQMCQIPGRFWLPREHAFFLKCYADYCGLSKPERKMLVHDVFGRARFKNGRSGAAQARSLGAA